MGTEIWSIAIWVSCSVSVTPTYINKGNVRTAFTSSCCSYETFLWLFFCFFPICAHVQRMHCHKCNLGQRHTKSIFFIDRIYDMLVCTIPLHLQLEKHLESADFHRQLISPHIVTYTQKILVRDSNSLLYTLSPLALIFGRSKVTGTCWLSQYRFHWQR